MPLDPDIPFKALAGLQRVQPYDPIAVQTDIDRQQVYQAQAQKAQQEMQAQAKLQQLAQQYGDDYDGLISAMAKEGYADKSVALAEGVWKSRGEAAKADQEQSKSSIQHLELGTRILQMANENPDLYPVARDWITKQAPQLSPILPPTYDKPTVEAILKSGTDTKSYFEARDKAAGLLINKDTRGSILTAFAGASNQQQWDSLMDGYKKLGLAPLLSLVGPTWSPEAQAKAAKDSITPEKQAELSDKAADNARQAAVNAETARHNRVEEGLGAGNLGVRKQELQRQITKDKTEATTGAEITKLPAAVAEKVAGVEQSLSVLADLQKMIDDPKSGMKARIGPTGGYMLDARVSTPGVSVDPSLARFSAQTATLKNATVKAITGAQMSEPEAKRIMAQVPTMYDKPEVWAQKAATTKENLSLLRQRLLQLSGVNVDTGKPAESSGKRFQILSVK